MGKFRCTVLLLAIGLFYVQAQDSESDSDEHGQFKGPKTTTCPCGWTNKAKGRIVGGKETKVNEYPFMAGLARVGPRGQLDLYCGATILTTYHALTAAHCTDGEDEYPLAVIAGEHDFNDDKETPYTKVHLVKDIIQHRDWDDETYEYDIALLVVKKKFEFNQAIGPACLPTAPMAKFLVDKHVKITGWGDTEFEGTQSPKLLKVNVKVVPLGMCAAKYRHNPISVKNPTQLCTFTPNKDSCQGDSGGPVTWLDPETNRYTLVGVVSYGLDCGKHPIPGVNTDVQTFLPWIQENIKKSSPEPVNTCAKKD